MTSETLFFKNALTTDAEKKKSPAKWNCRILTSWVEISILANFYAPMIPILFYFNVEMPKKSFGREAGPNSASSLEAWLEI